MNPHNAQAQCILFRRYPSLLQPFKYAGYPLLLQAISLPAAEAEGQQPHFLSEEVAPRLQVLPLALASPPLYCLPLLPLLLLFVPSAPPFSPCCC